MAIDKPSDELKNKTNINPVGNRFNEATAEDFQEISAILEQLGITVDDLTNDASSNPYYGRYTSLALLQAAHTTAQEFAWAIIDEGPTISPQIALWNNNTTIWELSGATTDKIFVASYANLPAPGIENIWYITLDDKGLYLYYNSQYNLMNNGASNTAQPSDLITLTKANGFVINIPSKPDNIDIWKESFKLINHPQRDFEYNNVTGDVTLYTEAAGEYFEIRPYGINISTQILEATAINQTLYNISGAPASIDANFEGFKMREGIDYTRTYFSTNNSITLINQTLIDQVKVGTIIDLRKF